MRLGIPLENVGKFFYWQKSKMADKIVMKIFLILVFVIKCGNLRFKLNFMVYRSENWFTKLKGDIISTKIPTKNPKWPTEII